MDKNKKKVIIIIIIILAIISLLAILLSKLAPGIEEKPTEEKPNETPIVEEVINKEIVRLNDEKKFWGIQKKLNDFYAMIAEEDNQVYDVLDNDYVRMYNINNSNIKNIFKTDYDLATFSLDKVYYNPNSTITYYFVNGFLINNSIDESVSYYKDIKFLIIVKNNKYTIKPLDSNINLEEYAKNYNLVSVDIKNSSYFKETEISTDIKLTTYLVNYFDLLFLDTEKAFNMLDDNTKIKYNGYEDFANQIMDIYEKYSTKIFSCATRKADEYTKYSIIDENQNKIVITEYNIMDFKIGF